MVSAAAWKEEVEVIAVLPVVLVMMMLVAEEAAVVVDFEAAVVFVDARGHSRERYDGHAPSLP